MEEYLNPRASLTPAIAGAMTTTLTGTLASQFDLPGNWTGLIISFALGLFVFQETKMGLFQKVPLYLLNSLTIFSVAMGLNAAGAAATRSREAVEFRERQLNIARQDDAPRPFFQEWW